MKALADLANPEKQARVWTADDRDRWHNWGNFYENYFDCIYGDNLGPEYWHNLGYLNEDELREFAIFQPILEAYEPPSDWDYDDRRILADPQWRKVVEQAKTTRDNLLALTLSKDEVEALLKGNPQMDCAGGHGGST